jgi:CBS domain-containing protein
MPNRPITQVIEHQRIVTTNRHESVADAARLMANAHVGAIMIVDRSRLIGIFTERDALFRVLAHSRDPERTTLAEVMTPDPLTIRADRPLGHALHMMYDNGFRHVPVIDAHGHPIGMVSARDALGPEMVEFEKELQRREEITELLC